MNTKRVVVATLLGASLVLGSVAIASADEPSVTPTPVATTSPVATTYADQLAAYKDALAAYQVAMEQYRVAAKAAQDQYAAAVKAATLQFQAAQQLRKDKRQSINAAFQAAVAKARADQKIAAPPGSSPETKLAAQANLTAAISSAATDRLNALNALGPELVRPTLPAKPIKAVEPVKPTPPAKSAASFRATTTIKTPSPKANNGKSAEKNK